MKEFDLDTYRTCEFHSYPRHADEGLVEIFDRSGGLVGRLVPNIAYASMGDELAVGDGVLGGEMLLEVILCQARRQTTDEDA